MTAPINPAADDRNFCTLVAHCEIRALVCRIGEAVVHFFVAVIVGIYDALCWTGKMIENAIFCTCCDEEDDNEIFEWFNPDNNEFLHLVDHRPAGPVAYDHLNTDASKLGAQTVEEAEPTEAVATQRREEALLRLAKLDPATPFACSPEILDFDLDAALQKYPVALPFAPSGLLEWYDYAMPDESQKEEFQNILQKFVDQEWSSPREYGAVLNLISKIDAIFLKKKNRVQGTESEESFKQQIHHVITRFFDASQNCVFQPLSQLEEIVIDLLVTENPLAKNSALSLIHYRTAGALLQYRANLIKEICITDPRNKKYAHMANFERDLKAGIAADSNLKGAVFQAGSGANQAWGGTNAKKAHVEFSKQYNPVNYLQGECRTYYGSTTVLKVLRNDLLTWARNHYGLDGEDPLSKALSEDPEADAILGGGNLSVSGILFLLESAGIIFPL